VGCLWAFLRERKVFNKRQTLSRICKMFSAAETIRQATQNSYTLRTPNNILIRLPKWPLKSRTITDTYPTVLPSLLQSVKGVGQVSQTLSQDPASNIYKNRKSGMVGQFVKVRSRGQVSLVATCFLCDRTFFGIR
jgi:hypothetical protein